MAGRHRVAVLLAPLGVLIGHGWGYLLAGRNASDTLHAHLPSTALVAAALALAAAVHIVRRPANSVDRSTAVRLAALQVLGFMAMEVAERAIAGAELHAIASDHAVWAGVAAQVVVAWLFARLVRTAADFFAIAPPRPRMRRTRTARTPVPERPRRQEVVAFARLRRGPPAVSLP